MSWQSSFVHWALQLLPAFSLSVERCMSLSHFTLRREKPCQLLNVGLYRKDQSKLCTLALCSLRSYFYETRGLITRLLLSWYRLWLFSRSASFPKALFCFWFPALQEISLRRALRGRSKGPGLGGRRLKDGWKMERDGERWRERRVIKQREAAAAAAAVSLLFVLQTLRRWWPRLVPMSAQTAPMGPCAKLVRANWAC